MSAAVMDPVAVTFRALAETVVPEAAQLSSGQWEALRAIVESALRERPARLRRQARLLVRIIDLASCLRYGRSFAGLSPARRTALARAFQDAPLLLLRRGFWGLRTLVFMGYYGRPEAAQAIGYRADLRGWEVRR